MNRFFASLLFRRLSLSVLFGAGLCAVSVPALAQSSSCQDARKFIEERQSLVQKVNSFGKKKMQPSEACNLFGRLVNNGSATLKWMEANKDWCQIPDEFVTNLKGDHERATNIRGQACKAAAQQAEMIKRARQQAQQQQQGGGMLGGSGGDILTGPMRIPQGAL